MCRRRVHLTRREAAIICLLCARGSSALVQIFAPAPPPLSPTCTPGSVAFAGSCYSVDLVAVDFVTAKAACAQIAAGARLVSIEDQAEDQFVLGLFIEAAAEVQGFSPWLGASSIDLFRKWSSGEPVIYSNWGAFEPQVPAAVTPRRRLQATAPSQEQAGDRCARFTDDVIWITEDCASAREVICEWPATASPPSPPSPPRRSPPPPSPAGFLSPPAPSFGLLGAAVLDSVSPTGAPFDASTTITFFGSGLEPALGREVWLRCRFDLLGTMLGGSAFVDVLLVTPTSVVCAPFTPAAAEDLDASPGSALLPYLEAVDESWPPAAYPPHGRTITVYALPNLALNSFSPLAVSRGEAASGKTVGLFGAGFADYGGARCEWGAWGTSELRVLSPGTARCTLPAEAAVDALARIDGSTLLVSQPLRVTLDGQHFVRAEPTPDLYVHGASVAYATPSALSFDESLQGASLTIVGSGIAPLPLPSVNGSAAQNLTSCLFRWRQLSGGMAAAHTPATVSPGGGAVVCDPLPIAVLSEPRPAPTSSLEFDVSASLDGGTSFLPFALEQPRLLVYARESITLESINPPAGSTTRGALVTIAGAGFDAASGAFSRNELCCVLRASEQLPAATGCAAVALLLPSNGEQARAVCELPPRPASSEELGAQEVALSLNSGSVASTTVAGLPFSYAAPPNVTSVVPSTGAATGGEVITIFGAGFGALSALLGNKAPLPSVLVGTGALAYISHTDTTITGTTPFGTGDAPITVSLHGQPEREVASGVRFSFVGLHPPVLQRAAFDATGTALVLRFGDLPTNRAGMVGLAACALVLAPATVDEIRGSGTAAPLCYWRSDTVLIAQLSQQTAIAPGFTVQVAPDTLAPALFSGGCPDELCAGLLGATISTDAPCEDADGSAAPGGCPTPVASISAPSAIAACPASTLTLDGSTSSAGGAGQLIYLWSVDGALSDNALALDAKLRALPGGTPIVALSAADLNGGARFDFVLRVRSALGVESSPATHTVLRSGLRPTLTLLGASRRSARADATIRLSALPSPPSCLGPSTSAAVSLAWSVLGVTRTASGTAVTLGSAEAPSLGLGGVIAADRATLRLPRLSLRAGLTYTLALDARLVAGAPSDTARVTVAVAVDVQPMRASFATGDRTVSSLGAWRIDASSSTDPNLPAQPTVSSQGGAVVTVAGITFAWTIAPLANASGFSVTQLASVTTLAQALAASAAGRAVLSASAGALPAGVYEVSVTVSPMTVGSLGAPSSATHVLTLAAAALPTVRLDPLSRAVYNAEWSVPSQGVAVRARLDSDATALLLSSAGSAYSLAWTAELVLPALDGTAAPRLVPAPFDLSSAQTVTRTGASRLSLALRSGVLAPGATYRFTLSVTPAGGSVAAKASADVRMNRPPFGGSLAAAVLPRDEGAIVSTVELRAVGWQDDDEQGLPLIYEFRYSYALASAGETVSEATSDALGAESTAPRVAARLHGGNYTLIALVSDQLGARARASVELEVPAAEPLGSAALVKTELDAASRELDGGDSEGTILLVRALAAGGALAALRANSGADAQELAALAAQMVALLVRAARAGDAEDTAGDASLRRLLVGALADVVRYTAEGSNGGGFVDSEAIVENELDGPTQAQTLEQLTALATAALDDGLDDGSFAAHAGALRSVLARNASGLARADERQIGGAARELASALARALLVGSTGDEGALASADTQLAIAAQRARATSVGNLTVGAVNGSAELGSALLPPGVLEGTGIDGSSDIDATVDVLLSVFFERNVVGVEREAAVENGGVGDLLSSLFSLELRAAPDDGGGVLTVAGLSTPVRLVVPLQLGDSGACTSDAECGVVLASGLRTGECAAGRCACASPFAGATCSRQAACAFFDEAEEVWSSAGCETLARTASEPYGVLLCACTHLTSFGGVRFPNSAEEFEENINNLRVNTLSTDDLAGTFTQPDVADNLVIYTAVFLIVAIDVLLVLVGCALDTRERRRTALRRGTTYKLRAIDKETHTRILAPLHKLDARLRAAGRNAEVAQLVNASVRLQAGGRAMLARRRVSALRYGRDAVDMAVSERRRRMARERRVRKAAARTARERAGTERVGLLRTVRTAVRLHLGALFVGPARALARRSSRAWLGASPGSGGAAAPAAEAISTSSAPARAANVHTRPISTWARLWRRSLHALRERHPLSSVLFAHRPQLRRAQLAQCLCSLLMLQLLVEAILYDPHLVDTFDVGLRRRRLQASGVGSAASAAAGSDAIDSEAELLPFEYVLVVSLMCAALSLPALVVFRSIFRVANRVAERRSAPDDLALWLAHRATAAVASALAESSAPRPSPSFIEWTSAQLGLSASLAAGASETSSFKACRRAGESEGVAGGTSSVPASFGALGAQRGAGGAPLNRPPPTLQPTPPPPTWRPSAARSPANALAPKIVHAPASDLEAGATSNGSRPGSARRFSIPFVTEPPFSAVPPPPRLPAPLAGRAPTAAPSDRAAPLGAKQRSGASVGVLHDALRVPLPAAAQIRRMDARRHQKRAMTVIHGLVNADTKASARDQARALQLFLSGLLEHIEQDASISAISARELDALEIGLSQLNSSAEESVLLRRLPTDRFTGAVPRGALLEHARERRDAARRTAAALSAKERAQLVRRVPAWVFGAVAWCVHAGIFAVLVVVLLSFGRTFNNDFVLDLMVGWTLTILCTLTVQEPIFIALFASMPVIVELLLANPAVSELIHSFLESWIGQIVRGMWTILETISTSC